jgi:hypothetical protein
MAVSRRGGAEPLLAGGPRAKGDFGALETQAEVLHKVGKKARLHRLGID